MPADPQSTLYLVLAIGVALLTIFVCVALIYLILIFRDVSKILEKTRDTAERINEFVIKPVTIVSTVVDRIRPIVEAAMERRAEMMEEGSRKKRK
ncbi:hypothetical protein COV82_01680 [Candidatus Peregrinibacteria bacterium CG11_big_fil_rev_8_21_14_0_20_46_8]|nr:MAG: hypothetical protein COV82_01680 [Candidatus Peregrinibacteria bacterium CG11_big_fil_rev_8_21_14_0_20_46_8]